MEIQKVMICVSGKLQRGGMVVYELQEEPPKLRAEKEILLSSMGIVGQMGDFELGKKYELTIKEEVNG